MHTVLVGFGFGFLVAMQLGPMSLFLVRSTLVGGWSVGLAIGAGVALIDAAYALCGAAGVFLLGVAVYAGLRGTEAPDRNFALTFVFVTCWLGFPLFSVVFGDVFRPFNPWRAIGRCAGGAFTAFAGQRPAHLAYPDALGRWPAAVGLLSFVWLEIAYGTSGDDTFFASRLPAGASSIYVYAGAGNDTIRGTEGSNILSGEAGTDHLFGLGGNDTFEGGDNDDMLMSGLETAGAMVVVPMAPAVSTLYWLSAPSRPSRTLNGGALLG